MSRIEEMLRELCPEGVEYWSLGEVVDYSKSKVSASNLDESSFVGVDNLKANCGGRVDAQHGPNTEALTEFQPNDVLLGNIRPYLKKAWLSDRMGGASGDVLVLRIRGEFEDAIIPDFLYYIISSDSFFRYDQQHARGGKMPRGDKMKILEYRIPVPPLGIQREIVDILDSFTRLKAELEAELEARKVQYSFLRNMLLNFEFSAENVSVNLLGEEHFDVQEKRLGDIALIKTGRKFEGAFGSGLLPYVNGGVEPSGWVSCANNPGMVITIPSRGSVGVVGFQWDQFWLGPLCYAVTPKEGVDPRFLYHQLKRQQTRLVALQQTGSIPALNKKELVGFVIDVPPLYVQRRIADVLDDFDALVNDLSSGLPAEIAARRQQYEYYRDRLFTFPEKK